MYYTPMPPIQLAERLVLLLALAFFLGLAFEEVYKHNEPEIPGGVRTFPLVALAGALLYLVEPNRALAFCAGLLALAAWLLAFLREQHPQSQPGRTLVIPATNLLVYALGPVVLIEPPWVAIGATVAAVMLIGWRERMHGFVRLVPPDEILTAGKFLILAGIILPLLPDNPLIAAAPLTPYRVWLAVIAISGLSYLTYLVQRYFPVKGGPTSGGALLPALLGGAYSSTATTVVLAKRQRQAAAPPRRIGGWYRCRDDRHVPEAGDRRRPVQPAAGREFDAGLRLFVHCGRAPRLAGVAPGRARHRA
jgi:hypothetical protein